MFTRPLSCDDVITRKLVIQQEERVSPRYSPDVPGLVSQMIFGWGGGLYDYAFLLRFKVLKFSGAYRGKTHNKKDMTTRIHFQASHRYPSVPASHHYVSVK